jgi:hypothetical protein
LKEHEHCQEHKIKARVAEKECESLQEQIKQLKEESIRQSQDEHAQEMLEKQQLHSLISKLSQEKERVQELQRYRQKEADSKV